ncbi:MAG TPA: methyltransferase domain-containing protein [Dehalococcoidia bacterium]
MAQELQPARIDQDLLRRQIQDKYAVVAHTPEAGFHFHTGRPLAEMLGYPPEEIDWLPPAVLASFAGTGNPFAMGRLRPGETVLDLGCGAGADTLIAARQVGPTGRVIAVDMTEAMLEKAQAGVRAAGLANVEVRHGFAEALPVEDGSVDVVISNGVLNLCPDKLAVMREVWRVLRPGGRIQIGDMVVHRPVPQEAKEDVDLWSG